jgi:hypothetical protein
LSCSTYHSIGNTINSGYETLKNFGETKVADALGGCASGALAGLDYGYSAAAAAGCVAGGTAAYFGVEAGDAAGQAKDNQP